MHADLDIPTIARITGRKSTITGMFFAALTPVIEPTDSEVRKALQVLGMKEERSCALTAETRSPSGITFGR